MEELEGEGSVEGGVEQGWRRWKACIGSVGGGAWRGYAGREVEGEVM